VKEAEAIIEIQKLEPNPGDIIVLRMESEQHWDLAQKLRRAFPTTDYQFLLISPDMEIECLDPAKMEEMGWIRKEIDDTTLMENSIAHARAAIEAAGGNPNEFEIRIGAEHAGRASIEMTHPDPDPDMWERLTGCRPTPPHRTRVVKP
jgi:hypothetical protein